MKMLVIAALLMVPDGKGAEPVVPPPWEEYEQKAYNWDWETGVFRRPLNKPKPSSYWPISEWTLRWYKKRWAYSDAYRLTVPQYYMTPFITRDMKE